MSDKRLFDAIRKVKGSPLTQADVDLVNAALRPPHSLEVPQAAIDLMKEFEGFRAKAYPDPGSRNGLPVTIGYGSTTDLNGKPVKLGTVWTREQAGTKFAQDLQSFSNKVREAIGQDHTTPNQFGAMVSLAYNIGISAFKSSTLLRKHKNGDYAGARAEFGKWRFNDGKEMAGLVRRRKAEAELYSR